MTLSIEIAPEVQSALTARAARLGVPVERYAAGVLRRDVEAGSDGENREYSQQKRRALIGSIRGKYAGSGVTVDELLRERHACDNL